MKVGINAIIAGGTYGMPASHIAAISNVAQSNNLVIGFRPVSRFAKTYLEKEHYPTKLFCIKNKSSNNGPMADLIAIDPQYSRVSESNFEKHNKLIEKALHHDDSLVAMPLYLSSERIHELQTLLPSRAFSVELMKNENPNAPIRYLMSWEKDGKTYQAIATENIDTHKYSVNDLHGNPIEVLGRKVIQSGKSVLLPVTADYDLLVVCPHYDVFDPKHIDKPPFRTQPGMIRNSLSYNQEIVQQSERPGYAGPKEDTNGGNWSPRVQDTVRKINDGISQIDPYRTHHTCHTVHHNAESLNPFADDLENNLPALIVLPFEINSTELQGITPGTKSNIFLAESVQELSALHELIKNKGYYWPSHAKYHDELRTFSPKLRSSLSDSLLKICNNLKAEHLHKSHSNPEIFTNHDSVNSTTSLVSQPQVLDLTSSIIVSHSNEKIEPIKHRVKSHKKSNNPTFNTFPTENPNEVSVTREEMARFFRTINTTFGLFNIKNSANNHKRRNKMAANPGGTFQYSSF